MTDNRQLFEIPISLPVTNNIKNITVPFPAKYIGFMNSTAATVDFSPGTFTDPSYKPADAFRVMPGAYMSMPVQENQTFSLFFSGTASAPNTTVTVIFSNEKIEIYGAVMNNPGSSITIQQDNIGLAKDGTDQTGVTPPAGAAGIRGWLSAIYNLFQGGTAKTTINGSLPAGGNAIGTVGVTSLPAIPAGGNAIGTVGVTSLPGSPAQDGTDATGVTQLSGGAGIRGWLSGIFSTIGSIIGVAGSAAPGKGVLVAGSDGTNLRYIKTEVDGTQDVLITGSNVEAVANATAPAKVIAIGGRYSNGNIQYIGTMPNGDGQSFNPVNALNVNAQGWAYNENYDDRWRNNTQVPLLTSASRTATNSTPDQTNYNACGLHVVLDVTVAGTGSITLEIDEKDPTSGKYIPILTGVAVTSVSTTVYKVFPGATAVANSVANDIVPRTYRVTVTHNNSNAITYSVGASLVLL